MVIQRCTQEDEAVEMRSGSQENEAEAKQRGSEEEEPVVMQRCGDEAMECPGLHHRGENKKEWRKTKPQQHAEKGGQTPRTGSSGAEQAAGAAAPRTESSRNKWRRTPRTESSGAEQEGAARTPGTGLSGEKRLTPRVG